MVMAYQMVLMQTLMATVLLITVLLIQMATVFLMEQIAM
jgi:hypothetical protein